MLDMINFSMFGNSLHMGRNWLQKLAKECKPKIAQVIF